MYCDPPLLTYLIPQDPPTARRPTVPHNMEMSVPHRGMRARSGSSGHLIEPPNDEPRSRLPADCLTSNLARPGELASVSFLEAASNFTINNSTMNNIGRDATFINNYGSVKHFPFAVLHYFIDFVP